jgi:hypothetical protein
MFLFHSLKLRCDRAIPCGSCVKRGCGAICPDGATPAQLSASQQADYQCHRFFDNWPGEQVSGTCSAKLSTV